MDVRNHYSSGKDSSSLLQVRYPLLRRSPRTACPRRGWQEPVLLLETFSHPPHPQGGCPDITLPDSSCPEMPSSRGFSGCSRQPVSSPRGRRPSPGAWRLQATPPCALWAGPAPLLTSLLALAGRPSPPSVYFLSGWGPGSWKPCSHPLPTFPLEDQTHCGPGKAPSSLP